MSQSVNVSYDPVRVQRVIIEGNDHTADSFIFNKLKSIPESKDVGTLTQNISSSMRELSHTNLFKNIAAYVDSAESGEVGDVDVIIDLKEKTRFTVTFGIFQATDGSSTTGSVTGEMRNIVGHGEGLTLSCNVENEGLSGVNLSSVRASLHSLPLFKDSTSTNSITVFKETHNRAYYSSLTGTSTGVSAGMTSASGVHNVEIESAFRHYSLAAEHSARATPEVLSETFAPTTKNALKYAYRVDTRADGEFTGAHFPTEGALKLVRAELAGLGGDVAFTKVECLAQWLRPVAGSAVTAALTVRGGVVRSWDALARLPAALTGSAGSGDAGAGARGTAVMSGSVNAPVVRAPPVPIADRFFQNNLFVRGFTPREISPQVCCVSQSISLLCLTLMRRKFTFVISVMFLSRCLSIFS